MHCTVLVLYCHLPCHSLYVSPPDLSELVLGQLLKEASRAGGWQPVDLTVCEETLLIFTCSAVLHSRTEKNTDHNFTLSHVLAILLCVVCNLKHVE